MKTSPSALRKKLHKILAEPQESIRKEVAREALEYGSEDIVSFFEDLLSHGCVSGMIGSLIYYVDTHKFFDTYYDEIEELRLEWEDSIGIALGTSGDWKNYMAWFAFEETAYRLANEFGLEV